MSDTPFMPLWVADFIKDTLDLEAKEVGAYMLLLMAMWGRNGYLPNDHTKLKRVARVGRDWPKVWASIEHYFTVEGDAITQDRLLKEFTKVAAKRVVNAQSGARGGRAKALKYKDHGLANATVSLKQSESEPYKTEEGKPSSTKKRGSRLPDGWRLPKQDGEWAVSEGWPEPTIRTESEKFKDYWHSVSGQKAVKLDWSATWRNWMRNSNSPKVSAETDRQMERWKKLANG